MSEAETDDGDGSDGDAAAGKGGGKKKLIIIGALAVVLLAGGGAAAYVMGLFGGGGEPAAAHGDGHGDDGHGGPPAAPVFYALPDLVVTLNSGERKTRYLKAHVILELARAEDQAQIELMTPRILDFCQIFLRELRPDELRGSAAIVRMREELLKRINAAVAPVAVRAVLFTDLLVE